MKTHKVIIINPGCHPRLVEIPNDLHTHQALVGGSLEIVLRCGQNIDLIGNEEAMLDGLPPNIVLPNGAPLAGTLLLMRANDEGEFIDCDETVLRTFKNWLAIKCKRAVAHYEIPMPLVMGFSSFEELEQKQRELEHETIHTTYTGTQFV